MILIVVVIIRRRTREPKPSPGEIFNVCEATPVANGLTVDAKQPTWVPTRAIATATNESKPTPIITGINNG